MYYNYYKDILYRYNYIDSLWPAPSFALPLEDGYNQYQSYQVNQYYNQYHYLY